MSVRTAHRNCNRSTPNLFNKFLATIWSSRTRIFVTQKSPDGNDGTQKNVSVSRRFFPARTLFLSRKTIHWSGMWTVITSDYVAILFISNEMLIVYGEIIGILPRPQPKIYQKMVRCCDDFSVVERANKFICVYSTHLTLTNSMGSTNVRNDSRK